MGTRLYVGNLSYNVTEQELRDVFAEGGRNVVEVKVVMDCDTGRPRGFAFVEMGTEDDASYRDLVAYRARDSGSPHQRQRSARARAAQRRGGGGYGGGGGGGGYGGGGGGGGGGGRRERGGGGGGGGGRQRRGGW